MENRQVTININDTSPLANTAYVDLGKENKVYNKAQVNELIEDAREGTLGSISPSQTLEQLNALADGNYYATEAGTYAFGEVVPVGWQYRFNKSANQWKVLTKVEIPMQDLTEIEALVKKIPTKFGISKIVNYANSSGYFYLTTLNSNTIRIDFFKDKQDSYTTAHTIYYTGVFQNDKQRKGLEKIKLNGVNTDDYIDVYVNAIDNEYTNDAANLNNSRLIDYSIFTEQVFYFNDKFLNETFESATYIKKLIISNSIISLSIDNNYNAKLYLESLFVDKDTKIARFRFRDANGSGVGVDVQLADFNINLNESNEGSVQRVNVPANVFYELNLKIDSKLILEFISRTGQNFDFYNGTFATNEVKYTHGENKIVLYNSSILDRKGYIVANGNSLTTSSDNQRFSDYIQLAEGDGIRIVSMSNNIANEIFDYVVCICTYDDNLQLNTRILNKDQYNLNYIATSKDKFIRLSCATSGLPTFRLLINRKNKVDELTTVNTLKRLGDLYDSSIINGVNYTKIGDNKLSFPSMSLPSLNEVSPNKIDINFKFNSRDAKYVDFDINGGVLQWIDKNDILYFTKNIGYNEDLGVKDRTIIFYSDDYCNSFKILYDAGHRNLICKDWELMCLFVSENGNIYFTKSEDASTSLVQQTLWEIKGWKNGEIIDGKDGDNNIVTIKRKFKFSYDSFIADREDLDFRQYGETTWPDYGILIGSNNAARGRMLPGWSYNVYGNIVMVTEYGESDSYWTYKNKLQDQIVSGKHTIVNKTNGLGVSSKVWISLDNGETFKIAFDLHQKNTDGSWKNCGDAENAHLHAINFNPYDNNFYIVNGDLTRDKLVNGFEDWMKPNQRIIRISYDKLKKWWDSAPTVSEVYTPSVSNYTGTLPEWEVIKLPAWRVEGFGHEYQLQFGTIEPFPNSVLFSTDSDVNVGFFRYTNALDFVKPVKELPQDDVGRSHFGGNQQYLRSGDARIISVVPHHANTVGYIYSTTDGNDFKLIYKDVGKIVGIEWGVGLFPTKKGIFCRPGNLSENVFILKNKSNFQ